MTLFVSVKGFFNKEDYDFDRDDIDLYNFHPQLRAFLAINGIFFNNRDSILRLIWPTLNILISLVGLGFEIMFVFRGLYLKDYAFASESFCYVMVVGTVPVVYGSVLFNRDTIIQLLDSMNSDFLYICKLGAKHKEIFLQSQLLIWKCCYLWIGLTAFTAILYVLNTIALLLYQGLFATQDEHTVRPLIFPMWLPKDDPYRTPNFEIFLFLQMCLCSIIVQTFGVYVYTKLHFLLHYYAVMDMIILDFDMLFEGIDESAGRLPRDDPERARAQRVLKARMRRIVTWHTGIFKSIHLIAKFFGPPLVYQVFFTSFGICIMAYQVADQLDQGKFDFLFAALCIVTIVQLWIPCYLGTLIRNKGFAVGEACWNSGWHTNSLTLLLRNDIVIFLLRTQQPVSIQFTGLPTLQLETFSSIMSTSYSYFNMLRQSTKS